MGQTATIIGTPLAEMHRADGAQVGTWFGCALPDDFGAWLAEYRFARESVGVVDQNYHAYFDITGPDRIRYLNAILTNNIKGLADHHGAISLLLNPQGRILAELDTYAFPERILGISYAMIREALIEVIEKYIIMDDVTLKDETQQRGTLALTGPKAALCASKLTGREVAASDLELRECTVAAIPCSMNQRTVAGVANFEFLTEQANLRQLWNVLVAAAKQEGGGGVGYTALNAVRLGQGIPWFGYDFGDKQIPHEAGLQDSHISYTKGCYTGQEIVERVRSRGQVNRTRVLLKFDTAQLPVANTPLLSEAKEFGYVTSAAFSPAANGFIGMGYVRKEKSAEGSTLEVTGGTATVYTTPLIAASA